jgi:hypothetical protein
MKTTPELVAKLIFASSQLRYFEQQLVMEPSDELHDIVIRWQCKVDEVLCLMDADQYIPLKTIIDTVKLNEYAH